MITKNRTLTIGDIIDLVEQNEVPRDAKVLLTVANENSILKEIRTGTLHPDESNESFPVVLLRGADAKPLKKVWVQ